MKCIHCGADIMDPNGKCEFCGNYQNDPNYVAPNNYEPNNYDPNNYGQPYMPMNNKKKGNKIVLITVICITFFIILAVILILVLRSSNSSKYKFEGNWSCANGVVKLKIDSKNFYYDSTAAKVDATYEIEYDEYKESPIGNYYKYGLLISTTSREINGVKYTEPYTTEYEIDIEEGKENELLMTNTTTYNMFECYRID